MIDAKELKIGNYIYASGLYENRLVKVEQIGSKGTLSEDKRVIMFEGLNVGEFSCDCNPIPLTPEWLAKLGFEQEKSKDIEERDIWSIQVANNTSLYYDPELPGKEWYLSLEWNNNHWQNEFWATPKSVHQVQNLYYALTSEELTIKSFNQSN